ncbi:MAG: ATP-binding protein [Nannocystaceae bacterium]
MKRDPQDAAIATYVATLERCLTGDEHPDAPLAERLALLSRAAQLLADRATSAETQLAQIGTRLEEMLAVVTSLTALEYDRKVPLAEDDDWIVNALAIGLNIMGDELATATRELKDARDRALAASRAKSAFLANMSHELRTPLNAIIGYSELIREDLAAGCYERIADDLANVARSAHHLLNLIQDTLDLSKIEAGKMELVLEEIDASGVLRDLTASVEPILRAHGNELDLQVPDGLVVTADRTKLKQIFLNLLSNAAKFTKHGTVRLRARTQERARAHYLVVDVSDTGVGIPANKLPLIFGAYNQAEDTTSAVYGGTGLGLTISRHYAEMMGGELLVDSIVGVGSTFTVALPIAATPSASPHTRLRLPDNVVLVADRDPRLHDVLRRELGYRGFVVLSATAYHDLLALTASFNPVMMIVDLALEGEDEWSALAKLRRERGPTPLVMTGDPSARERPALRELGLEALLPRPVDVPRVVDLVARHRETIRLGTIALVGDGPQEDLRDALLANGWLIIDADPEDPLAAPSALVVDLSEGADAGLRALDALPWRSLAAVVLVADDEPPVLARPHVVVDVRTRSVDAVCVALSALLHRTSARA